jgi:hypothetical protein
MDLNSIVLFKRLTKRPRQYRQNVQDRSLSGIIRYLGLVGYAALGEERAPAVKNALSKQRSLYLRHPPSSHESPEPERQSLLVGTVGL